MYEKLSEKGNSEFPTTTRQIGVHEENAISERIQEAVRKRNETYVKRRNNQTLFERRREAERALDVVRKNISNLPEKELTVLLSKVEDSLSSCRGNERSRFIMALFESSDSASFTSRIIREGLDQEKLYELVVEKGMPDKGMSAIISTMLTHPDKYRLPLGIIFSQVSIELMPEDIKRKIAFNRTKEGFSLETSHEKWFLCDDAESTLDKSIDEKTVLAITEEDNDSSIIMNIRRKMYAICLDNIKTGNGRLLMRGNLYSLTDKDARDKVKDAFKKGKGKVGLDYGAWAYMRPVKLFIRRYGRKHVVKSADDLFSKAKGLAENIPVVYPDDYVELNGERMTRKEYLERKFEED